MHRSFESWSEDFVFSDELEALETGLSMTMAGDDATVETPAARSQNLNLDHFVNIVTQGVLEKLSDGAFIDKFLYTRELRNDNERLAAQVKHLLQEKKRLEADLMIQADQLARYKKVAGNIFLKLE